jgi:rRNA processing protein Krr1/Pno1
MQEIYSEEVGKIMQSKERLETELDVVISSKGKLVFVDGEADKEYIALHVLEAVNLKFSIDKALLLKTEDMILQTVRIKDITKRKDIERIRARIIGVQGKTLKTLNNLTDCEFSLRDNDVGVIGTSDSIEEGKQAIISLIHGSKQGNVYARIEKEMKKKRHEPISLELKKGFGPKRR